jgi:nickel transport protein
MTMLLSRGGVGAVPFGLAVIASVIIATPAAAHKASAFATVQGKAISGEAYFRDGSPIRNAQVTVLDPDGGNLGETKTDPAGKFSFEPRRRCDHRFVVDGGDGHVAQCTVAAGELPAGLPQGGPAPATGNEGRAGPSSVAESTTESSLKKPAESSGSHKDVRDELEAIQTQIAQLRRELAAREDRTRFRDILGGIGYILGLMGLTFYFLGSRRARMKDKG